MIAVISVSLVYADSIDLFSDAFGPVARSFSAKQTHILEKN